MRDQVYQDAIVKFHWDLNSFIGCNGVSRQDDIDDDEVNCVVRTELYASSTSASVTQVDYGVDSYVAMRLKCR